VIPEKDIENRLEKLISIVKSIDTTDNYLLEELAALEHKQWVQWSQSIAANEKISIDRLKRWQTLWVPYSQLSEKDKDSDRSWAREVISIMDRCKN